MTSKFELRKASNNQYYFTLKAENGERILSGEMYHSKAGAENGIESIKNTVAIELHYERRTSTIGQHYFVLKALNNEVLGISEMYASEAAREKGIASVKLNAPYAQVIDMTS